MKRIYFVYSQNIEEDKELVRALKDWLPTDIDIKDGTIYKQIFKTLDNKIVESCPHILERGERPVYITGDAYEKLLDVERNCNVREISNILTSILDFEDKNQLICGRKKIQQFISQLRKP